jgi:adenylylsulfate kinase-like enzyme
VLRLIFDSAEQASEMYLDGDTLRDALKQVLALPPEERLNQLANIFASVAEETWSSSGEEEAL